MIKLYLFLVFMLFGHLYAQDVADDVKAIDHTAINLQEIEWSIDLYTGISAGSESFLSLPKGGIQANFMLLEDFYAYTGVEAGFYVFFAFWYNANIYGGIRYKAFLLENSFGMWQEPASDIPGVGFIPTATHFTITPKIGILIRHVKFRIGHSFVFFDENNARNRSFLDTGVINFNLDIGLIVPFVF